MADSRRPVPWATMVRQKAAEAARTSSASSKGSISSTPGRVTHPVDNRFRGLHPSRNRPPSSSSTLALLAKSQDNIHSIVSAARREAKHGVFAANSATKTGAQARMQRLTPTRSLPGLPLAPRRVLSLGASALTRAANAKQHPLERFGLQNVKQWKDTPQASTSKLGTNYLKSIEATLARAANLAKASQSKSQRYDGPAPKPQQQKQKQKQQQKPQQQKSQQLTKQPHQPQQQKQKPPPQQGSTQHRSPSIPSSRRTLAIAKSAVNPERSKERAADVNYASFATIEPEHTKLQKQISEMTRQRSGRSKAVEAAIQASQSGRSLKHIFKDNVSDLDDSDYLDSPTDSPVAVRAQARTRKQKEKPATPTTYVREKAVSRPFQRSYSASDVVRTVVLESTNRKMHSLAEQMQGALSPSKSTGAPSADFKPDNFLRADNLNNMIALMQQAIMAVSVANSSAVSGSRRPNAKSSTSDGSSDETSDTETSSSDDSYESDSESDNSSSGFESSVESDSD